MYTHTHALTSSVTLFRQQDSLMVKEDVNWDKTILGSQPTIPWIPKWINMCIPFGTLRRTKWDTNVMDLTWGKYSAKITPQLQSPLSSPNITWRKTVGSASLGDIHQIFAEPPPPPPGKPGWCRRHFIRCSSWLSGQLGSSEPWVWRKSGSLFQEFGVEEFLGRLPKSYTVFLESSCCFC